MFLWVKCRSRTLLPTFSCGQLRPVGGARHERTL
jgi:hypothetical protein